MSQLDATGVPGHVDPALIVHYDIYSDERIAMDPHEGLLKLRSEAPGVFYTAANGGHWVAIDSAAITQILRTTRVFSNHELAIPRIAQTPRMIPESLDPPEHSLYRDRATDYGRAACADQREARATCQRCSVQSDPG